MKVRELYVEIRQRGGVAVQNVLKGLARNSDATRKAFSGLANAVVADSARMAAALRDVGDAMRAVRVPGGVRVGGGGGAGGGAGGTSRPTRDPLAGPIADANRRELAGERARLTAEALRRGSSVGTRNFDAIGDPRKASGRATAAARAADLSEAVERNQREMSRLRAEAVRTGDADRRLAAEQKGLAVATGRLALDLRKARAEVAAYDKAARGASQGTGVLSRSFGVLTVAAGNLLSAGITRVVHGIGDAVVDAGKKSIEFESNMAQVAKVVDGLRDEAGKATPEFDKMSDGLKKLSTTIGLEGGTSAFAGIVAEAGQSGLEDTTEGLLKFGEDAAKTAVAFNITAEEAGKGIAQIRNGLVLNEEAALSLLGTYNLLDTEGGAAAKDLLEVGTRIGAVGKAAQVSGQEIAAFSAIMLGAGETPERAATATKNFVLALAAGDQATKRQAATYKALGFSAADVAKRFTGSMQERREVTLEVLNAINKLSAADKVAATTALFGKDSLGGIAAVTTNVKGLEKALDLATDKQRAALSLQNEYAIASQTTANKMQLLRNNVDNAKIALGDALAPVLADLAPMLVELAQKTAAWLRENKELVTGKLKDFVTGAIETGRELLPVLGGLVTIAVKFGEALGWVTDKLGGTTVAAGILAVAVGSLAGPWGIAAAAAIVAIGKIGSALADLIKQVPDVGDALMGVAGRLQVFAEKQNLNTKAAADDQAAIDRGLPGITNTGGFGPAPMASGPKPPPEVGDAAAASSGQRLGARGKGRKHKQTKMDKNLSRLDPSLAGVLTQGGEEDSGGDLKVSGDVLSRAAYRRSAGIGGGIGSSGGASGPNITNIGPFTFQVDVDARGNDGAEAGVYRAAERMREPLRRVVLTGLEKVIATRHAGGRLTAG